MLDLQRLAPYRPLLVGLAVVGFVGLNGVFLAYAVLRPDLMMAALANPISLVFILEAFVLMGLMAWAIWRLGLTDPGWKAFVVLSVVGSLAFSVPAYLWLRLRRHETGDA